MKKSIMASLLLAATLFSSDMAAQEKYVYNEFYFQRSSLFSELPVGKKDIVFLGDSQTNGCEWHELLGMKNVKNRGISSDVIQGFIDRVDPIVEGQPAKVFILGGVNDISHDLTPDSLCTSMEKLIVKIKQGSPRTKIYLQSLLPIDNSFGRYRKMVGKEQVKFALPACTDIVVNLVGAYRRHSLEIVETNRLYKEMAERHGVTWIDLYSKMVDPATGSMRKGLTNDGLHLLGAGYLVWRDAVLPYVKK